MQMRDAVGSHRFFPRAAVLVALLAGIGSGGGQTRVQAEIRAAPNCAPITIDIGHTPEKPGATSARGAPEHAFNRRFAIELRQALAEQTRYRVELAYGGRQDLDVHRRAKIIEGLTSGVLLSIHHDSVQPKYLQSWDHDGGKQRYSDRFSGFSLFVSGLAPAFIESAALGQTIGQQLVDAGFAPSLHHAEPIPGERRPLINAGIGLYRYDALAVLRYARVPAVLIELGIIVNRRDEERLGDAAYRKRLQGAIVAAMRRFCATDSARRE